MNVTRLTEIANAIRTDLQRTKLLAIVSNIIDSLNKIMSQPNEAHQNELRQRIEAFNQAINKSKTDEFPTTWRPYLKELGIQDLLGESLRARVLGIIQRNEITLSIAKDEITAIHAELTKYIDAFNQIVAGMSIFTFITNETKPREAELSLLFPREAFGNGIRAFADEVRFFDRATRFFSELATGSREEPQLRQLSTSDPLITIGICAGTVLAILQVIEKIQTIIEKTYAIREAKRKAEEAEAGRKAIGALQEAIEDKIENGIKELKDWLFREYTAISKERAAEMRTEFDKILPRLAARLDNGYEVDGNIDDMPAPDLAEGQEPNSELTKRQEIASRLIKVAQQIRYHERPDRPVLQLPGSTADGDENADDPV